MKRISLLLIAFLIPAAITAGCSKQVETEYVEPSTAASATAPATPSETSAPVQDISPDSSWTLVGDLTASLNTNVVGFVDEKHGIAVGGNNEILYTDDGGLTWAQASGVSNWRYGMCFVDENLVWAGGWKNAISVSRDGGRTWSDPGEFRTANKHSQLSFLDDKTGWVASYSEFGSTCDGGATWTAVNMPEGVKRIGAIDLLTVDTGYLLTLDGWIYTTNDSGLTWSGLDLELGRFGIVDQNGKNGRLMESQTAVAEVCFADANSGMIIFVGLVPGKGYEAWMLATSDGGSTWREEQIVAAPDYKPTTLYLTEDGNYLTLCDNNKRTLVLKRK